MRPDLSIIVLLIKIFSCLSIGVDETFLYPMPVKAMCTIPAGRSTKTEVGKGRVNMSIDEGICLSQGEPRPHLGCIVDGRNHAVPTYSALSRFDGRRLEGQLDSSDSLPSVVRDFMGMFKGGGSYPDDLPNSLRA
ncbi:hypothetical protein EV401DRAFT_1949737 [Pisolithus croceorrhizus]|nr:hypothetical protein EV401DRAFT_1949737 [Pisolithus croceorrhizus]